MNKCGLKYVRIVINGIQESIVDVGNQDFGGIKYTNHYTQKLVGPDGERSTKMDLSHHEPVKIRKFSSGFRSKNILTFNPVLYHIEQ